MSAKESLCRDATDQSLPCRFWEQCHEARRRLQHYAGLRGEACWAFQQHTTRMGSDVQVERAAIQAEARA